MNNYAITIKKAKNDVQAYKEDIDNLLVLFKERYNGYWITGGYELDEKSKLHYHGTLRTDYRISFRKFQKERPAGWHVYIRKQYSKNWDEYCIKNAKNKYQQEQQLVIHYYRHNRMFIRE